MASIITIDDISDDDIAKVLSRAAELLINPHLGRTCPPRILSLVFLEPSLRTRLGFTAAAARLGWQTMDVFARRGTCEASLESWSDTLRTIARLSDAVVARPARSLGDADRVDMGDRPLINGGDTGPKAEHPSQALIDLFAMEQLVGPIGQISVVIVGDPRMRVVRSLMGLLARKPAAALTLLADPDHLREISLPPRLQTAMLLHSWEMLNKVDVVYIAGIPHQSLPLDRREALRATARRLDRLPPRSVLMSPMPVIDEMDASVRDSKRNLMFKQSELGLYLRMALLEHVVGIGRGLETIYKDTVASS
jgi:aspartate carbamoyltransferase catalytic subunit